MHKPNRYSLIALSLLTLSTSALPTARAQGMVANLKSSQARNKPNSAAAISQPINGAITSKPGTTAHLSQPIAITLGGAAEVSIDPETDALLKAALHAEAEEDFATSLATWSKLAKKFPDGLRFKVGRLHGLEHLKHYRDIVVELEPLIKKLEEANERYAILYFLLLDSYMGSGQFAKAKILAGRMVTLFAHRGDLLLKLERSNGRLKDQNLATQIRKTIHELQTHDLNKAATLLAIKPSAKSAIPNGKVLDIVVCTNCFPRFKLRIAPDRLSGDSGVIRYIIAPPDYKTVRLIDDDSKNYLPLSLDTLLMDHCNWRTQRPYYSSISKTGSANVGGYECDIYKCQFADESTYHLLYLSRDIKVEPALAASISQLCFAPPLHCLPLKMRIVCCGESRDCIRVVKFGQSPLNTNEMTVPNNYHRVKDMAELELAGEGALKDSDIDDIFSSNKKSWKKPAP